MMMMMKMMKLRFFTDHLTLVMGSWAMQSTEAIHHFECLKKKRFSICKTMTSFSCPGCSAPESEQIFTASPPYCGRTFPDVRAIDGSHRQVIGDRWHFRAKVKGSTGEITSTAVIRKNVGFLSSKPEHHLYYIFVYYTYMYLYSYIYIYIYLFIHYIYHMS